MDLCTIIFLEAVCLVRPWQYHVCMSVCVSDTTYYACDDIITVAFVTTQPTLIISLKIAMIYIFLVTVAFFSEEENCQ